MLTREFVADGPRLFHGSVHRQRSGARRRRAVRGASVQRARAGVSRAGPLTPLEAAAAPSPRRTRLGPWPAPTNLPARSWLFDLARPAPPAVSAALADALPGRRSGDAATVARARRAAGRAGRARSRERAALVDAIRRRQRDAGGVDALLREYDLSSSEGIVLMCLAEALLRIPDAATADRLIADKLGSADWQAHLGESDSLFVNASTWALLLRAASCGPPTSRRRRRRSSRGSSSASASPSCAPR